MLGNSHLKLIAKLEYTWYFLFGPLSKHDSMSNTNVSSRDLCKSGQEMNMKKEGSRVIVYF